MTGGTHCPTKLRPNNCRLETMLNGHPNPGFYVIRNGNASSEAQSGVNQYLEEQSQPDIRARRVFRCHPEQFGMCLGEILERVGLHARGAERMLLSGGIERLDVVFQKIADVKIIRETTELSLPIGVDMHAAVFGTSLRTREILDRIQALANWNQEEFRRFIGRTCEKLLNREIPCDVSLEGKPMLAGKFSSFFFFVAIVAVAVPADDQLRARIQGPLLFGEPNHIVTKLVEIAFVSLAIGLLRPSGTGRPNQVRSVRQNSVQAIRSLQVRGNAEMDAMLFAISGHPRQVLIERRLAPVIKIEVSDLEFRLRLLDDLFPRFEGHESGRPASQPTPAGTARACQITCTGDVGVENTGLHVSCNTLLCTGTCRALWSA